MVRLFHRENECYVSAEGSFAESPAVIEDGGYDSENLLNSSLTDPFNYSSLS